MPDAPSAAFPGGAAAGGRSAGRKPPAHTPGSNNAAAALTSHPRPQGEAASSLTSAVAVGGRGSGAAPTHTHSPRQQTTAPRAAHGPDRPAPGTRPAQAPFGGSDSLTGPSFPADGASLHQDLPSQAAEWRPPLRPRVSHGAASCAAGRAVGGAAAETPSRVPETQVPVWHAAPQGKWQHVSPSVSHVAGMPQGASCRG